MGEAHHYAVHIKEKDNEHWITTEYIGFRTREQIIEFYGLDKPDVEAYQITEINDRTQG
jgi:hypothetical protein